MPPLPPVPDLIGKVTSALGVSSMAIVFYALVLGMTVGMWRDVVVQKADKSEVSAIADDVHAIRSLLCKRPENVGDSWCLKHQ